MPQAASNEPYTTTLAASGGLAPYTWTLPFGALPTGYALGAVNSMISGTTAQNGTFRFILSVNDSSGQLAVKECTMATAPAGGNAFTLTSITPNQALAGSSAVTITLRGAGFNSSSTVVWNAGTGNTVNLTTTFVDAGTLRADIPAPLLAAGGGFPIAVRRTVLTSPEFTNTLIFTVSGGLAIQTTCPLPAASQGTPYRYQLVVTHRLRAVHLDDHRRGLAAGAGLDLGRRGDGHGDRVRDCRTSRCGPPTRNRMPQT